MEKWDWVSQAEGMSSLQSRVNWITDEPVVGSQKEAEGARDFS